MSISPSFEVYAWNLNQRKITRFFFVEAHSHAHTENPRYSWYPDGQEKVKSQILHLHTCRLLNSKGLVTQHCHLFSQHNRSWISTLTPCIVICVGGRTHFLIVLRIFSNYILLCVESFLACFFVYGCNKRFVKTYWEKNMKINIKTLFETCKQVTCSKNTLFILSEGVDWLNSFWTVLILSWYYIYIRHVGTTPSRGGADFYFRLQGGGADWPFLPISA